MAKRKTPKMEKIIDITPKPEKISKEQLNKLQTIVSDINKIQHQVGVIETKKHNMMHGMSENQTALLQMQMDFEKEYKTFDIDINTGTINYPEENGETNKKDQCW